MNASLISVAKMNAFSMGGLRPRTSASLGFILGICALGFLSKAFSTEQHCVTVVFEICEASFILASIVLVSIQIGLLLGTASIQIAAGRHAINTVAYSSHNYEATRHEHIVTNGEREELQGGSCSTHLVLSMLLGFSWLLYAAELVVVIILILVFATAKGGMPYTSIAGLILLCAGLVVRSFASSLLFTWTSLFGNDPNLWVSKCNP